MKDSYYCTLLLCLFIVSEFIVLLPVFHFWHYSLRTTVLPNVDTVHACLYVDSQAVTVAGRLASLACMLGAAVSLISDDIVLD